MANRIFRGDAVRVAQVVKITPANPEVGDTFTIKINGKEVSFVAIDLSIATIVDGLVEAWNSATFPEAALITAKGVDETGDGTSNYLTLTADNPGVPFRVTTQTKNSASGNVTVAETVIGVSPVNERQKIELIGTYTGGTFTISWDPGSGTETTAAIAYDATAADVQSALESLATPTAGDFSVTGNAGGPWYVTFQGTYAATNVNLMSVDGTNLSGAADALAIETVVEGRASAGEIQSLSIYPDSAEDSVGGTYTLSFDGETTSPLAYNASAATIQSTLEALGTIGSGNILVAGGQGVGPDDGFNFPFNGNNWYFALVFRNALAGINVSQITADFSNIFGGTVSAGGGVFASPVGEELQHVDLDTPTDGTYSLSFNGETTIALAYNASRQTVEAALEALPSISNVVVRGHPGQYVVHFTGPAGVDVSELVLNSLLVSAPAASVTTLAHGTGTSGTNEVQSVTVYATGGTFTLTFDGQTTAAIACNASAATVESALEALSNITDVTVAGSGTDADPWLITFVDPGGENVPLMVGDGTNLTGGGGTVNTVVNAVAGVDEQQTITLDIGVSGGTFTLSFDGQTTVPIAYSATAGTVESALEALATIDGVSVAGSAGGPWTVTFDSALLGESDVELLVADGSNLVGDSGTETLTLATLTRSQGPNHFDDPDNWTGESVPDSMDALFFNGGKVHCLYGLKQRVTFTADAATDVITFAEPVDFVEGQAVRFFTTDTLPDPLATETSYYIEGLDYDAGTCQLALTAGGAAIDITDAGMGTHTIGLHLSAIKFHSRWTGNLGLAERNEADFYEYLPRSLAIVVDTITIGEGEGDGQSRLDLDTGDQPTTLIIHQSGGSNEAGLPAIRWKGTNAANIVTIHDGELGVAVYATEQATIDTLVQHAGLVQMGIVTIGSLTKHGGELIAENAALAGVLKLHA